MIEPHSHSVAAAEPGINTSTLGVGLRHEWKYYLPKPVYPKLLELVRPFMTLDEHTEPGEEAGYVVRSLYLDTPVLRFYNEKVEGHPRRRKFRIRGYGDEISTVFLEIRGRLEDRVYKQRSAIAYEDMGKYLDPYGTQWTGQLTTDCPSDVRRSFLMWLPCLDLRPSLVVAYEREAHVDLLDSTTRLTIDRNLRCVPGHDAELFYRGTDWIEAGENWILEIKFTDALPFYLSEIVQQLDLTREAISKYCLCVDSREQDYLT